jgi:type IV pilus assembly protein PilA
MPRVNRALNARCEASREGSQGFTLIELLVVVIIVAIAIPVYLGVQTSAKDTAAKSDLANAKIAVIGYEAENQLPPATIDAVTLGSYGYGNRTVDWSPSSPVTAHSAFCLVATGVTGNKSYATDVLGVGAANAAPTGC